MKNKIDPAKILITSLIFLVALILLVMCSSSQASLFYCDNTNRIVIGYSENFKKYKVVDGCGREAQDVRVMGDSLRSVGTVLFLKDNFKKILPP